MQNSWQQSPKELPKAHFKWLPLTYWCICLFGFLFLKNRNKRDINLTSLVLARSLCLSPGGVSPILILRAYVCIKLCTGSCSERPQRVPVSHHGTLKRIPLPYTGKGKEGNGDYDSNSFSMEKGMCPVCSLRALRSSAIRMRPDGSAWLVYLASTLSLILAADAAIQCNGWKAQWILRGI